MLGPFPNTWGGVSWVAAGSCVAIKTRLKRDDTPVLIIMLENREEVWLIDSPETRQRLGLLDD